MRILFENLAKTASFSSGSVQSLNYPIENLSDIALYKRYQGYISDLSEAQGITLTFDNVVTLDTVVVGNTNGVNFTLALYDNSDTLLSTVSFTSKEYGNVFSPISGVKKAILIIDPNSSSYPALVRLGKVALGLSYTMPDPLADSVPEHVDNSPYTETLEGQTYATYIEPLDKVTYNFTVAEKDQYNEVKAKIRANGHYFPVWLIKAEKALSQVHPLYCTIALSSPKRDDTTYSFSLSVKEAR